MNSNSNSKLVFALLLFHLLKNLARAHHAKIYGMVSWRGGEYIYKFIWALDRFSQKCPVINFIHWLDNNKTDWITRKLYTERGIGGGRGRGLVQEKLIWLMQPMFLYNTNAVADIQTWTFGRVQFFRRFRSHISLRLLIVSLYSCVLSHLSSF